MNTQAARPLKNVQFVIANEVKQSHKPLIIKEIATAHRRLAMTGSGFFKGLAAETHGTEDDILSAAESVFQNMSKAAYPAIWSGVTAESRKSIIRNVRKALGKAGFDYAEERIRVDFERGEELARGYWTSYLSQFDPKTVLEESKWSMGEVKKDKAEIVIRYKKSGQDAILKMFREGGVWKVGLHETFSVRQ